MSDEKKEPWMNYLALTTVILAVCATLSTFRGSSYSTRSVLSQSQAANQWSYFQSKSVKGYLYELQKEQLVLEQMKINQKDIVLQKAYAGKIEEYGKKIQKYDAEKAQIQADAKSFEGIRDEAHEPAPRTSSGGAQER